MSFPALRAAFGRIFLLAFTLTVGCGQTGDLFLPSEAPVVETVPAEAVPGATGDATIDPGDEESRADEEPSTDEDEPGGNRP